MKTDSFIRVLAGVMVLISVGLTQLLGPWWLVLTCFVAVNLVQSAFTGFCLPALLVRRLGWIRDEAVPSARR